MVEQLPIDAHDAILLQQWYYTIDRSAALKAALQIVSTTVEDTKPTVLECGHDLCKLITWCDGEDLIVSKQEFKDAPDDVMSENLCRFEIVDGGKHYVIWSRGEHTPYSLIDGEPEHLDSKYRFESWNGFVNFDPDEKVYDHQFALALLKLGIA